jgi:hypothetical protein
MRRHWSSLLLCTRLSSPVGLGLLLLHCRLPSITLRFASRARARASFVEPNSRNASDPLTGARGSRYRLVRQRASLLSRDFVSGLARRRVWNACRKASRSAAVRHWYRRCVWNVSACSESRQHYRPVCRDFFKPSGGLEPPTPSLPWRIRVTVAAGRNCACVGALPGIRYFLDPVAPLPRRTLSLLEKPGTCPRNLSPNFPTQRPFGSVGASSRLGRSRRSSSWPATPLQPLKGGARLR